MFFTLILPLCFNLNICFMLISKRQCQYILYSNVVDLCNYLAVYPKGLSIIVGMNKETRASRVGDCMTYYHGNPGEG